MAYGLKACSCHPLKTQNNYRIWSINFYLIYVVNLLDIFEFIDFHCDEHKLRYAYNLCSLLTPKLMTIKRGFVFQWNDLILSGLIMQYIWVVTKKQYIYRWKLITLPGNSIRETHSNTHTGFLWLNTLSEDYYVTGSVTGYIRYKMWYDLVKFCRILYILSKMLGSMNTGNFFSGGKQIGKHCTSSPTYWYMSIGQY